MKNQAKLILALSILILASCTAYKEKKRAAICATCPEIVRVDSFSTVKIVTKIRDTTIITPADSSFYEAYIECINGKPVITKSKQKDGNRSSINVDIDADGILSINCKADSLQQIIHVKETEIERLVKLTKEATINVKDARFMENTFYYIGMVTCFLIALIAVVVAVLMSLGKKILNN